MKTIGIICGSLRQNSCNRIITEHIVDNNSIDIAQLETLTSADIARAGTLALVQAISSNGTRDRRLCDTLQKDYDRLYRE